MTTTFPLLRLDLVQAFALLKARGQSWRFISEKYKLDEGPLEYLPWNQPQEWAKAQKYAEKLVAHEALAETLAELRSQMKDPTLPTRLKTQVANSIVRIIQQQHALRTPKQPKKATRQPLQPIEQPALEPPVPNSVADTPKPTARATPLGAVAAVLLFVLLGTFGVARGLMAMDPEPPVRTEFVADASGSNMTSDRLVVRSHSPWSDSGHSHSQRIETQRAGERDCCSHFVVPETRTVETRSPRAKEEIPLLRAMKHVLYNDAREIGSQWPIHGP